MQIEFRNRALVQLYTTGKSGKSKLPGNVINKFFMRVQQLEAADDIYDLWKTASLNFEKLEGYRNRYSVRLDRKWRLEMEISWDNDEKTKGTIYITGISRHYGD